MFEQYDDILTAEEACEALRIGSNALYELLGSGELKGSAGICFQIFGNKMLKNKKGNSFKSCSPFPKEID